MKRVERLGKRRELLRRQLAEVNERLRPLAVRAVAEGEPKIEVAAKARATRRALDQWIAESLRR